VRIVNIRSIGFIVVRQVPREALQSPIEMVSEHKLVITDLTKGSHSGVKSVPSSLTIHDIATSGRGEMAFMRLVIISN
jgi:hypothetical protein